MANKSSNALSFANVGAARLHALVALSVRKCSNLWSGNPSAIAQNSGTARLLGELSNRIGTDKIEPRTLELMRGYPLGVSTLRALEAQGELA